MVTSASHFMFYSAECGTQRWKLISAEKCDAAKELETVFFYKLKPLLEKISPYLLIWWAL